MAIRLSNLRRDGKTVIVDVFVDSENDPIGTVDLGGLLRIAAIDMTNHPGSILGEVLSRAAAFANEHQAEIAEKLAETREGLGLPPNK
jgi:hypothetical protein